MIADSSTAAGQRRDRQPVKAVATGGPETGETGRRRAWRRSNEEAQRPPGRTGEHDHGDDATTALHRGAGGRGAQIRSADLGGGGGFAQPCAVAVAGAAVVAIAAPARQGRQMRAAEEDFDPIIVNARLRPVADEARGHGVGHPPQHEAARRRHGDHRFLAVLGATGWQRPQHGALDVDALAVAGVAIALF